MSIHIDAITCQLLSEFSIWPWLACENGRFSTLFAAEDVSLNVPSGEEREKTAVFAGWAWVLNFACF